MPQIFSHPAMPILLWCTILALIVALALYIVGRFRGDAGDDQPAAGGMLSNFRELHSQGGLSDQEFRTIKTLLAEKIQGELKDTSDKG